MPSRRESVCCVFGVAGVQGLPRSAVYAGAQGRRLTGMLVDHRTDATLLRHHAAFVCTACVIRLSWRTTAGEL